MIHSSDRNVMEPPNRRAWEEEPDEPEEAAAIETEPHASSSDDGKPHASSSDDDDDAMIWKKMTLIDSLKAILKDYPANEQMLKELIQNAEDAGAKEIKFLYDANEYPRDGLKDESLREFQGPALYAYNDASFTKEDFKNLVSIQKSSKMVDRSKVGRFGRGFKSVFHMTELPCLLSGKFLGKIDPSVEDKSLRCRISKLLKEQPNELEPYLGKFGFTKDICTSESGYKGTIFRFPLRRSGITCKVSDTEYTCEKVNNLFETLKTQASMDLLFLKSLESIEVFTQKQNEKTQRRELCVSVRNKADVTLKKRGQFFQEINTEGLCKDESDVSYVIDIQNSCDSASGQALSKKFLVCHYFNSKNVSETFQKLLKDKNLNNNPVVSVAIPLLEDDSKHGEPINDGHLFCFLPLPVEGSSSPTGLPIHINSFFAVDSKRSKIEWPTDQDGQVALEDRDPRLIWNHCLVTELLPEAYARLLQGATEESSINGSNIYRYFPQISEVNEKWRDTLLPPFFERVLKMAIFPTVAGRPNKTYVALDNAVVCAPDFDKELQSVLVKLLVDAGKNVVCPPEHVFEPIQEYCKSTPVMATPSYIRRFLKINVSYKTSLSSQEKLCLLKFLVEDDAFGDLSGLQLLPTADGKFLEFSPSAQPVYIVDKEKRMLLPTLEPMIISVSLHADLKHKLQSDLACDQTQLHHCTEQDCVTLLSKVVPGSCVKEETINCSQDERYLHLSLEWLKHLWHFLLKINKTLLNSLKELAPLHILPTSTGKSQLQLAKLSGQTSYVVGQVHNTRLTTEMSAVLRYLGVKGIQKLPDYVLNHPLIFDYIHSPSAESVMKAVLAQVTFSPAVEMARQFNSKASLSERKAFQGFVLPAMKSAKNGFKDLLKQLKIFNVLGNKAGNRDDLAAVVDIDIGVASYELPLFPSKHLLDLKSTTDMAKHLNIDILNETDVLERFVFDDVRNQLWKGSDLERMMTHVLQKLDVHCKRNKSFLLEITRLPFLSDGDGRWLKPEELFDMRLEPLKKLFIGEDKFPGKAYSAHVVALVRLGLKTEASCADIISTVNLIQDKGKGVVTPSIAKDLERKAEAIIEILSKNKRLLTNDVVTKLKKIDWLPVQSKKPSSFPTTVHWKKPSKLFVAPLTAFSASHVNVVGLSLPIVKTWSVGQEVVDSLVKNNPLPLQGIIAHLSKVVESYTVSHKPAYMKMAMDIYGALKNHDVELIKVELERQELKRWLWHGNGFTSADCVVTDRMSVANLHPYVYQVPDELEEIKNWLQKMGVPMALELTEVLRKMHQWYSVSENRGSATKDRVQNDGTVAVRIVNKIAEGGNDLHRNGKVLVPVTGGSYLTLLPAEKCTYCDSKLDPSDKETLEASFIDDGEPIHYLNPMVSKSTAMFLGVQTLDFGRLCDDSDEFDSEFEESGQHESLTRRISHLLEENYRDGLVIPKELVQNADDAEATEIKFLFDERENKEYCTGLLDDEMKKYQGPALWVYNDAKFTDEDLANIRKLSGATKERKRDKIGQFGLGFNAVYNVTDVPSFVTGEYIVFFDPHRTNLKKVLKKDNPGLRINLCAGTNKMSLLKKQFANQFKPYNGIFGCCINQGKNQPPYDGTLFRFPLRPPGAKSELKNHEYSKADVRRLLQVLGQQANKLLLFTQNVKKIGIYHLSADAKDPAQAVHLFEAERNVLRMVKELDVPSEYEAKSCGMMKVADLLFQSGELPRNKPLHSSTLTETKSTCFPLKRQQEKLDLDVKSSSQTWLMFSCIGKQLSLELGKKLNSCTPVAGVAAELKGMSSKTYQPVPNIEGAPVFCHMPLPSTIRSGLPVIVNGSFALTSDRQHLLTRTADDTSKYTVYQWNDALMRDAVVESYLCCLEQTVAVVDLKKCDPDPYCLWPVQEKVDASFQPFADSFYAEISSGRGSDLKILLSEKGWVDFKHAVFLDEVLARSPLKNLALLLVQSYLNQCGKEEGVVVLPERIQKGFSTVKIESVSLVQFYELAFFPNIMQVEASDRNKLMLFALERCKPGDELSCLVQSTACITVKASKDKCLKPGELIFPKGKCGELYDEEDERFPTEEFCTGPNYDALIRLGMATDVISWEEVVLRAKSIQSMPSQRCARVRAVLAYIEDKLPSGEPGIGIREQLREVKFLPILEKPKAFTLSWKGNEFVSDAVASAMELFPFRQLKLIGNTCLILNESESGLLGNGHRKQAIFRLLGLEGKVPALKDVIHTLNELSKQEINSSNKYIIQEHCKSIYSHLDECCDKGCASEISKFLIGSRCILVSNHFMEPRFLARNILKSIPPYLSSVPASVPAKLRNALNIRDKFSTDDYIEALHCIKADELTEADINTVRDVAECLKECQDEEKGACATTRTERIKNYQDTDMKKSILLPAFNTSSQTIKMTNRRNDKLRLLPVKDLCLHENSKSWLRTGKHNLTYVHSAIPHKLAEDLGVRSDCENLVASFGTGLGQPFGQKEKLTTRIKGILDGYPFDRGILKELLQNADDAEAARLAFILDHNSQKGQEVMSDTWRELQGPALCVYNDKPFTRTDLEGICSLGLGSKNADATKTGQYGIGFNSVYHLTDVPSFLTKGDEIGKTIAIFDPNCRFVPGATTEFPGRCFQNEDLEKAIQSFPDSLKGYFEDREDEFPIEDATMFRLPLRTRESAKESEISGKAVSFENIENVFENLKKEVFECLMFVNSVRDISFVNTKNPKQNYSVKVKISEHDKNSLTKFAQHIQKVSKDLKSCGISLNDVPYEEVIYTLSFEDSRKRKEVWSVCQSIGFKDAEIPDDVLNAYRCGDISLLPRGGAAICKSKSGGKHGMFCFLPLPQPEDTGLPFHINGHFALDANRRGLWGPDKNCYRTSWNILLLENCIAKACVSLVNLECDHLREKPCPSSTDLKKLYSLFPEVVNEKNGYENILASAFYTEIASSKSKCLAACAWTQSRCECRWFTVDDCCQGKAVFDNPFREPVMNKKPKGKLNCHHSPLKIAGILSRLGYNLLEVVPQFIFKALTRFGVKQVSSSAVVTFIRQYDSHPENTLKNLPQPINESPFMNTVNLIKLIRYCLLDDFDQPLDGLPLCLTNDATLRVFDAETPVFEPEFSMLIPERPDLFLHDEVYCQLPLACLKIAPVPIKKLTIREFASSVRGMKEYECFLQETMEWNPSDMSDEDSNKLGKWLRCLWRLIQQEFGSLSENVSLLLVELKPLMDFCILPASTASNDMHVLYRVKDAKQVVHPNRLSRRFRDILPLLKELDVPMLETGLCTEDNLFNRKHVAENLVSDQQNGVGTLEALWCQHKKGLLQEISKNDANCLLDYFANYYNEYERYRYSNENLQRLPPEQILALPMHITADGSVIPLDGFTVYLIPRNMPKPGLENCFSDRTGAINRFILKSHRDSLYKVSGCCSKNEVEIYTDILLLEYNFCTMLTEAERLEHLNFVASTVLPDLDSVSSKYKALVASLQGLPFVTDTEGQPREAIDLFDPTVHLYRKMETDFPSEKFLSPHLLDLLRKCLLKTTVTASELLKYAEMVEEEASTDPRKETGEKSRLIVEELKARSDFLTNTQLFQLKAVRFIPVEQCPSELTDLHDQYLLKGNTCAFTCFKDSILYREREKCWTAAAILPAWIHASTLRMQEILKKLEVHNPVPMKIVVSHCTKLSQHLALKNMAQRDPNAVVKIMKVLYEYFQQDGVCLDADDYKELAKAPCVCVNMVNAGDCMINPSQVIIGLSPEKELKPYLFKLPNDVCQYYDKFFCKIGVREQPDYKHYMAILKVIHDECEGQDPVLEVKQVATVKEAITQFVHHILKEDAISLEPSDELYLQSRRKTLEKSTEMVIVDDVRLLPVNSTEVINRQVTYDCIDFTVDQLQRLPDCLRPRLLSSLVEEILDENSMSSSIEVTQSGLLGQFKLRLKSVIFQAGLRRLLHHDAMKSKAKSSTFDEYWSKLQEVLNNIKLFTVPDIVTVLRPVGSSEIIANSRQESSKNFTSLTNASSIYLQQTVEEEIMLSRLRDKFAKHVTKMMKLEAETALVMVQILSCSPNSIALVLDESQVPIYGEDARSDEPELGGFIPLCQHYLLRPDYTTFWVGEMVGLECDDPLNRGEKGEATYMYAKIMSVIRSSEGDVELALKYEIDIRPDTTRVVGATDLFQFMRNKSEAVPDKPLSLEEAKKSITADLTYAFESLSEDDRNKFLKRLIMKWALDDRPNYSSEILTFIEEQVGQLKQKPTTSSSYSGTGYNYYPRFCPSHIFRYARERASKHRDRIQEHRNNGSSGSSNWLDYSFLRYRGKNPQPGEARRWCRQASYDLLESRADVGQSRRDGYEWALQKCHQQESEKERFEKEEYKLMLSIREEQEANEKLRSQNARKDQAIKETRERLAISERNSCLSPEQLPPQDATEGCHQDERQFEQIDRQGSDETEKVAIQEPLLPAVGDANEMEKKSLNSREEVSSYQVGFSIDRPFTEDLNDPKSAAYRELENDVTKMMETAIGDDLIEVTIIGFKKGCIEIVSVIKVKKDGNINEAIKEHLRKDSVCQCMKVKETSIYVTESNDEKQKQDENKATTLLQTGDASGDGSIANISAVGGSVTIHQTNNTVVDCEYRAQQAKKIENLTHSLAEERKTREQLQREGEMKDTELAKMKRLLREKDGELREKDGELREKDGELREKKGVVDGMLLSLQKLQVEPVFLQLMEDPAKLAKDNNKQQNQIVGTYMNDSV